MKKLFLDSKLLLGGVLLGMIFFAGCFYAQNTVFAAETKTGTVSETGTIPGDKIKTGTVTETGTKNQIDENTDISDQFQLKNPIGSGSTDMKNVLDKILNSIVVLLTPVLVLMLIYSGYLFVIGRGNTEKITEAKKTLTYTLIGAVIVVAASGIAHVIENTVGAIIG